MKDSETYKVSFEIQPKISETYMPTKDGVNTKKKSQR